MAATGANSKEVQGSPEKTNSGQSMGTGMTVENGSQGKDKIAKANAIREHKGMSPNISSPMNKGSM